MARTSHLCMAYIKLLRARADMIELIHDSICGDDEDLFKDIDKFTIADLEHIIRDEVDSDQQDDMLAAIREVDRLAREISREKKAALRPRHSAD